MPRIGCSPSSGRSGRSWTPSCGCRPPALTRLHMDPEGSAAAVGGSAMLTGLPDAGIEAFLIRGG